MPLFLIEVSVGLLYVADELRDVNIMLQKSYHDLDEYKMKFFEAQQMANEKVQLVQDLQGNICCCRIID